ncbi:hypothetical protein ACIBCN_39785 [Nocardia sp. NPDC051052]|uniref:hypothetical protein n=1 Tax=Nocardia sp. NPDC051052 TaxID=3364322 RepID=UPI00378D4C11
MADDPKPTPLANLITEAREGRLTVRMKPEEFAKIDHECTHFKEVIRAVQQDMTAISQVQTWGFGDHPGSGLMGAPSLAKQFRDKAQGGPDSHYEVLEEHLGVVEDIRQLHEAVRNRLMEHDDEWAARFRTALASLEQEQGR